MASDNMPFTIDISVRRSASDAALDALRSFCIDKTRHHKQDQQWPGQHEHQLLLNWQISEHDSLGMDMCRPANYR